MGSKTDTSNHKIVFEFLAVDDRSILLRQTRCHNDTVVPSFTQLACPCHHSSPRHPFQSRIHREPWTAHYLWSLATRTVQVPTRVPWNRRVVNRCNAIQVVEMKIPHERWKLLPSPEHDGPQSSKQDEVTYLSVAYDATRVKKYRAELQFDHHVISGKDFWTARDAAKAYDELVTLYCDLDTRRNFSEGDRYNGIHPENRSTMEWQACQTGSRHADLLPCSYSTDLFDHY